MSVTAANLRKQDYQFQAQVQSGIWRWTTRVDLSGSVPAYYVVDVLSPFGMLRDTIPIPGDVVQAMSASIEQLHSNFAPSILLGPPSSLTFDVDEGRGFSEAQEVALTNTGVFGSLLGVTVSTSASYVVVTPANLGNLASNEAGSFQVEVNSSALLSANSPYAETLTVVDPNASNNPQTYPITINVRPKATIEASPALVSFSVNRPLSGPFPAIPVQQFSVENTGPAGSVLDFQVQRLTNLSHNWLSGFSPMSGTLDSGDSVSIDVLVAPVTGLAPGTYEETLRISGYSSNSYTDVLVRLTVV